MDRSAGSPEGRWFRDGEWYVWRERTTKPFSHIRIEATRTLFRGLAGLFTIHKWEGQTLEITGVGCSGDVRLEGDFLTTRVRFNSLLATLFPYVKEKVLSEVSAATTEVAGGNFFGSKEVFIIHGHNDRLRTQLKQLLTSFGLKPVVLVELNDGGRTIIEKFEYYAGMCSFALALMTCDDKVAASDITEETWRARANVNLEVGWFMARLGRTRVMLLAQEGVEIPSDLNGILYLRFQDSIMDIADRLSYGLRDAGLM